MSRFLVFILILTNISLAVPQDCTDVWASGYGLLADLNRDCKVDFADLHLFIADWLKCNDPSEGCDDVSSINETNTILTDGDTSTFIAVDSAWKKYYSGVPTDDIVNLRIYIDAASAGSLEVILDDVMSRTIAYELGQRWYSMRVPFSKTTNVQLRTQGQQASVCELYLDERTPITTQWPAGGIQNTALDVSLAVSSNPESSIPFGVMCNWFERGIAEGLNDSETRLELIDKFTDLGVSSWRYPGGTMTYGYPPTQDAIQVYQDAGLCSHAYGLCWDTVYWASPETYLDFCKTAGITAWYEINPGYWYDKVNETVHKTVPMDGAGDITYTDYLDEAVADAVTFAQYADSIGVDIVWEIGNEDYCYYKPATYAKLCVAFINGIRSVLPNAKFSVCGDGYSWSDHSFAEDFKAAMATKTITGPIDYSSEHLYLNGVGYWSGGTWYPYLWDTPTNYGNSVVSAWDTIKPQYLNSISLWQSYGFTDTKLALTEFNTHSGAHSETPEIEHSVGRALGEAEVIVNMFEDSVSCLFVHDLVRSSPDSTFFSRLDYYPENSAGRKYFVFPEARVVALTSPHGRGNIIYNSNGIAVSKHATFVYVTVINRDDAYLSVDLSFTGQTIAYSTPAEVSIFRAASDSCSYFDYYYDESQITLTSSYVEIRSYPYSVTAYKIYLQ